MTADRRNRRLRRVVPLAVAIAAALAVTGFATVVVARGDAARPAAADPPVTPSVNARGKTPDDLNTRARVAERRVTDNAKEIEALLAEMRKHVTELKPGDVKETMAIDAFRTLLPKLKAEARWLLDKRVELDANGQRYVDALERAHEAFLDLVPTWEKFAADEAEPSLKDHYAAAAKNFRHLAAEMSRRRVAFQAGATGVQEKLVFVERSHVFLERLERVVPILDNPATAGAEVQAYLAQVRKYIESFDTAMKAFKDLSDKMQAPPAGGKP